MCDTTKSDSVLQSTMNLIEEQKNNIEDGKINGIPFAIKEVRKELPCITRGSFVGITAGSKGAKTQLMNNIIIFNSILYAYEHPDLLRVKILFFGLEESPEDILMRFISYLLYVKSGYKIRVDHSVLISSDKEHLLSDNVYNIIKSDEIQDILKFYDNNVIFYEENNSVGIDKRVNEYADTHGVTTAVAWKKDESGNQKPIKTTYKPNDENEYVFVVIDHISLVSPVKGELNLTAAINNVSHNCVRYKNKYKYIPVLVQQQAAQETQGLQARMSNNIRSTKAGLADSKSTGNDFTLLLGLTNPYAMEVDNYLGYDVTKLKGYFRLFEIILNRHGQSNGLYPLFFDGAVNYFQTLPNPNDSAKLEIVYRHIEEIEKSTPKSNQGIKENESLSEKINNEDYVTEKSTSAIQFMRINKKNTSWLRNLTKKIRKHYLTKTEKSM